MESAIAQQQSLKTFITNFIENTNKAGKDKHTQEFIQTRITLLQAYWDKFLSVHNDIIVVKCKAADLELPYFKESYFETTELSYCDALGQLKVILRKLKPENVLHSTGHQNTTSATQLSTLPKIQLPQFYGELKEWAAFHDLFKSLIDLNTDLTGSQKLYYLKTSLRGAADQLLRNTAITDENYAAAWSLLCNRYQNERLLVRSYLKLLTSLPSMKCESAEELRKLYDGTMEAVNALESLKRPVQQWDDWLIFLTVQKLDPCTKKDWENSLPSTTELPTFEELCKFLQHRVHTLEVVGASATRSRDPSHSTQLKPNSKFSSLKVNLATNKSTNKQSRCPKCQDKHLLLFCPSFRQQTVIQRRDFVSKERLCFNCLRPHHAAVNCPSANRCKECNQQHHTMLHSSHDSSAHNQTITSQSNSQVNPSYSSPDISASKYSVSRMPSPSVATSSTVTTLSANTNIMQRSCTILLATAQVIVNSPAGQRMQIRALLDQGSQATFVSPAIARFLRLPHKKVNIPVQGIGSSSGVVRSKVQLSIQSTVDQDFCLETSALVLPHLTSISIPPTMAFSDLSHLRDLHLADPKFYDNAPIDLIIGADLYYLIILEGLRKGIPTAQNTALGWVLSGPIETTTNSKLTPVHTYHAWSDTSAEHLDTLLQRFWDIENIPASPLVLSEENEECEEFYRATTRRDAAGRYVVRLPIKTSYKAEDIVFGDSKVNAVRSLLSVERNFLSSPNLKDRYTSFMREYFDLRHMELISDEANTLKSRHHFYLPHHGVLNENSVSTKLRVVFNGSKKSKGGLSLNDYLAVGPNLQTDICTIILRWRQHLVALTADIRMMYRQIKMDEKDCDFQRILWRETSSDPVSTYRLRTVTYGTTSAPYLAIRTLIQLADDEEHSFPCGSDILRRNFYVDDVLFGAETVQSAIEAQRELVEILETAGFQLHKWSSNCEDVLQRIDRHSSNTELNLPNDSVIKTLGLFWNPTSDCFGFRVKLPDPPLILTKRKLLSDVAKLYDPLGFLSPTILIAKSMIQKLWLLKVDWDTPLPRPVTQDWEKFRHELTQLETLSIPRWIGMQSSASFYELHAFSDASQQAYAAVVYLRAVHDYDNINTSLLCAKTKLAPLKTISIPRLELMGAHLLAKLVYSLQPSLDVKSLPLYCWTDSQTVLTWLTSHPSRWKTFVGNRVTQILELIPSAKWRYVPFKTNPADPASRGVPATHLVSLQLWWEGPQWLKLPSTSWPQTSSRMPPSVEIDLEEKASSINAATTIITTEYWDLLHKYSSLTRLLRVTAWCYRFLTNCRLSKNNRIREDLLPAEITTALHFWIQHDQKICFPKEYQQLSTGRTIVTKSPLLRLSPFFKDDSGTIHVGGRLQNAALHEDAKHQFLLSKISPLSALISTDAHLKTLHGGVQLTLSQIRQRFWILGARDLTRRLIHQCLTCFRQRKYAQQQLMGILPAERVRPSRPFLNTGVDYAGPILIRYGPGRGRPAHKAYIALFVCMATKAVHLELVSDLTSEAFIAAYKRFTARRGYCHKIYSDNASTFIGASSELKNSFFLCQSQLPTSFTHLLTSHGTEWHFIPPIAPNFGGLWEAGVKAVKHHLKRIIGCSTLTFEEMYTLLTQVEACVNSRPLYPLSPDADDFEVLTPGHFLMGAAPLTVPEPSIESINPNRLSRWKLLQHMYDQFWRRWSTDYLNNLQERTKWINKQDNIEPGRLVLLREDHLPPTMWALGRIVEVHPGPDGLVRVITIKAKGLLLKRPINKVCALPISDALDTATHASDAKVTQASAFDIISTRRSDGGRSSNPTS